MGATNSAQVYRIATVQLEAIPVDQSSLGVVDAYFNNLGENFTQHQEITLIRVTCI